MSTDNTQIIKSDFLLSNLLVFINIATGLFSIMFLGVLHSLLNFTMNVPFACDRLHDGIFSAFAEKQDLCLSNAALWIFLISLIAMFISFIFYFRNEKKLRHLFLMLATGLNVTAGLYYLLMYKFWTGCEFNGRTSGFIFYCALIVIGIASLIWGIFIHRIKEECHTKKWVPIVLCIVLIIPVFLCMAYPYFTLRTEKAEMDILQQTIAAQDTNYDEKIGYQIGNYVNQNAIYIENKLYIVKHNNNTKTDEILTINKSGNIDVFWTAPNEIRNIAGQLYYDENYLYILANKKETDSKFDEVLRISITDGKDETLLESVDCYSYLGIHNNLLLLCINDKETKSESIYAYDLSLPITEENGYLYDDKLSSMTLVHPSFINYFVYGNREDYYFGSYNCPYMSIENVIYKRYNDYHGISGSLFQDNPKPNVNDVTISSGVNAFSIFDGKVFYIEHLADYNNEEESYGVYLYDLSSKESVLIGTIPYNSSRDCCNISMAEDFAIIYIQNLRGETKTAYLMWLDDGSYEVLW